MNVLLCLLKDIRSQYSCKWGVWVLSLRCQSQVYASASCCGSCRSGAEGKDALTDKRWRSVVKQREKYGGSETEQHHRKCNKEAESETVKGLLFCSARTQMRRRYFMCFPVGVWPPGAAPTSACLSGYKFPPQMLLSGGRRDCGEAPLRWFWKRSLQTQITTSECS